MLTTNEQRRYFAGHRPRIMAHRGSAGTHPENTMVSFEEGVRVRAHILETDVHMSLDGEVVVIHDPSVNRTTNGSGLVKNMPYAALRELDAGYNFSADGGKTFPYRGKGHYLPRFAEVLAAFPQMPINVEIKDANPLLACKMRELLEAHGRLRDGSVLVAADKTPIMKTFRQIAPEALTGHCRSEVYRFVGSAWSRLPVFRQPHGAAFQIPAEKLGVKIPTASVIRLAHELGTEVHVWTVNDAAQMKALIDLGVDGIFTDFPALMAQII